MVAHLALTSTTLFSTDLPYGFAYLLLLFMTSIFFQRTCQIFPALITAMAEIQVNMVNIQ